MGVLCTSDRGQEGQEGHQAEGAVLSGGASEELQGRLRLEWPSELSQVGVHGLTLCSPHGDGLLDMGHPGAGARSW